MNVSLPLIAIGIDRLRKDGPIIIDQLDLALLSEFRHHSAAASPHLLAGPLLRAVALRAANWRDLVHANLALG